MRRPEFIARQSGNPTGFLGRVIGWVMERETAAQNEAAITALTLRPDDRVLEIGHGPGRTLERLASMVPEGFVAGVDHSGDMHEAAKQRCARLIEGGQVELRLGDSTALPYSESSFNKALAVHTIYFWQDPTLHLREVYRVLSANGVCVLGFRPKEDRHTANFPASVYTFYTRDEVRALFFDVEFADIGISEPVAGLVLARGVKRT